MAKQRNPLAIKGSYGIPSVATPVHRYRYLRYARDKATVEEIAEQEGVTPATVASSIKQVGLYYLLANEQEVNSAEMNMILATINSQGKALLEALEAKKPILSEDGDILGYEPDHPVRMEAIARINEKIAVHQPKLMRGGSQTQVNIGIGHGQQSGGQAGGAFEDRLREIQKRRASSSLLVGEVTPEESIVDAEEVEESQGTVAEETVDAG